MTDDFLSTTDHCHCASEVAMVLPKRTKRSYTFDSYSFFIVDAQSSPEQMAKFVQAARTNPNCYVLEGTTNENGQFDYEAAEKKAKIAMLENPEANTIVVNHIFDYFGDGAGLTDTNLPCPHWLAVHLDPILSLEGIGDDDEELDGDAVIDEITDRVSDMINCLGATIRHSDTEDMVSFLADCVEGYSTKRKKK
jgi:hypothetical protein